MKQIINKSIQLLFLTLVVAAFTGCLKNEDLLTDGVRTGGLVTVTGTVPYKLGFTPSFDVDVTASGAGGEGIASINVKIMYTHNADTTESEVLDLQTITVNGANTAADGYSHVMTLTWAEIVAPFTAALPKGFVVPTDESLAPIGDYFTITYESVMKDGKVTQNNAKTTVSVANFFAGTYTDVLRYFHPTAGGSYPTDPYGGVRTTKKELMAVDATTCKVYFGVWTDNFTYIHINAGVVTLTFNRTAFVGDPNDAGKLNTYDPITGEIKFYYYYPGAGGNRIFWEYVTPV